MTGVRLLRLFFAAAWAVAAAGLLAAGQPFGWLALLLAAYNLIRWWSLRPALTPERESSTLSRPRAVPVKDTQYHPEFDFGRDPPGN